MPESTYSIGDRVIVCGSDPGTIIGLLRFLNREYFDVEFDPEIYGSRKLIAVGVIPEHLTKEAACSTK